MENEAETTETGEWLKDLAVQTETPAFKPEEMIHCAKCQRTNPPTRLGCFYCGAAIEMSEAQSRNIKLNLRKLEIWEKGFNLIFSPSGETFDAAKSAEIATLLNLERESAEKLFETGKTLPVARAESEKEAEIVQARLREAGVETFILSDAALALEKPQKRLRGLEFFDEKVVLIFFNRDEIAEIALEDVALIVAGAIFERRVEATEKRSKKGDIKILQSTETASDEFLFDVYSRNGKVGYRIFAKGFDFSCLAAEKEILAKDNLKKLARKLSEIAPNAKLNEDYLQVRENLGAVWTVEEKIDSQGLKREGFGRFNLGNITTVNNLAQFNKYSRLQWHLLEDNSAK
ncbi:MAG TPA: hypothetical protein VGC76_19420 [Pyrinomonadaceae bacterium]|jgi:hypothetical protein